MGLFGTTSPELIYSSIQLYLYVYIHIYEYAHTSAYMIKVYNFIRLPCHSSDIKHLTLQEVSLPGSC